MPWDACSLMQRSKEMQNMNPLNRNLRFSPSLMWLSNAAPEKKPQTP